MIVIVGCTGSTGSHLVAELTRSGHRVRATSRDAAGARGGLVAAGADLAKVELASTDLAKPETFGAALDGAERVYVAVGGPTGTEALVDVECRFIDAAKRAGVKHYVKVSGIDARPGSPSRIQQWHGRIAEHLTSSGPPSTILEPSFFMQNFLGLAAAIKAGVLPLPTGDAKAGLIDARDISAVGAKVLTTDAHIGARLVLTGPELVSHADVASIMARIFERPVAFQDLPQQAFEASMAGAGLPPWFAFLLADVYGQVFRTGQAARVTDTVERITGKPARTVATFLREHRPVFA